MEQSKLSGRKQIQIFTGGRMGHIKPHFTNARGVVEAIYGDKIVVETIDTDVIKEEGRINNILKLFHTS